MVRRQENDLSLQPVLVSQKFMEQVVVLKKYSRQSIINNSWLIRRMICSMRIMFNLAILLVIFNNEFLVSKETVVLRRWERSKQKFGFIKRVDKGSITTVKDLES